MVLSDSCCATPPHTGLPIVQDSRIEARPTWSMCLPPFTFNGPVLIDAS
jgi:hypothetical protein